MDEIKWKTKAYRCWKTEPGFEPYHQWIPISHQKSTSSDSVTLLMCGICFHEINISEAYAFRDV